jgi:DNA-binding PadR family transcriptional regulator
MGSSLGSLEELILLAVCGLADGAYAVPIQQHIQNEAGRDASMGAVYATLDRLEKKGYLRSKLGPVSHEQGGKRKRFYEISGSGVHAISRTREARERLFGLVDPALKPRLSGSS